QDSYRCEVDGNGHLWRRVRELTLLPYVGPVYNLSVELDESYVAEGIGVHNCTANAIAGAIEFDQMKQKQSSPFVPSRLFVYYNERVIEGTVKQDAGAMIRDGVKSVNRLGAPPESLWPYLISKFSQKPPAPAYKEALNHQVVSYQRVARDLAQMRGCLASGYPFVFGFTVYESFESPAVAKSGVLNMPGVGEATV